MTDDKGTGEGPYKIMLNDGRITAVSGPNGCWGRLEGEDLVMVLNDAHAAGRKAERERFLNVLKKYPDDGKELGDILEAIRLEIKGLI